MEKDKNYSSTDSGFELDKIDISRLIKPPTADSSQKPPKARPALKTGPAFEAVPERQPGVPVSFRSVSSRTKWITAAACVVAVVVTAIFLVWGGKLTIPIPSFKSDQYAKPDTYISVGPVISSVSSGDLIKMTLDINCIKKGYRKQVADMDSKIRNRVVWALQTPEAETLMHSGDYQALRSYLIIKVMEIMPKDTVSEIYISEFLRY